MTGGSLFCFGLGFSARRLSQSLTAEGWRVTGTCRTDEKKAELEHAGVEAHVFDGTVKPNLELVEDATHVLSSVPPGDDGDPVLTQCTKLLRACKKLTWLGYLSTTGVYGDTGGEWVDESSPVRAGVTRSQRRAEAEEGWLALYRDHNLPVHLFRLAGIYGPGRSLLDAIRLGQAKRIDKVGHLFSRIHVDDIVSVLRASMAKPNPGAIYNVCDDEPAAPADVTAYGCGLLGVEPPNLIPFVEAAKSMTPMGLSFWKDNRRVRNDRIKRELGVTLTYPTYREGLKALAGGE